MWYLDDEYNYYLTYDLNCPSKAEIRVNSTSQCVDACNKHSFCLICRTQDHFLYHGACLVNCPTNSTKNYTTHKCEEVILIGYEIPIYSPLTTNQISSYTLKTLTADELVHNITDTFNLYKSSGTSVIKIEGPDYSYLLYKNTKENKENKSLQTIELGDCETLLKEQNEI